MPSNKWRLKIELSYENKGTLITEFERICLDLKNRSYPRGCAGNSAAEYIIEGPDAKPFTQTEIEKLRQLIGG